MIEQFREYAELGCLIDPSSGNEVGKAKLTRAELAEGVGIFGAGYEVGAMVLAEGAKLMGFKVFAVDPFGKFWPLLNAAAESRLYLLGEHVLNPLKPEGGDAEAYVDLLCEALSHSFGTNLQTISDLKGAVLDALGRAEGELTLLDLASLFEAQSELSPQLTAYGALQPLLVGRSAASFKGRQTIDMGGALGGISVLELSSVQGRNFKVLAYCLAIAKLLDYARQARERVLLVADSPEIVWPDLSAQRLDSRSAFFYLHAFQMLRRSGIRVCLCSKSPTWIEKRVVSNAGTLIHFRATNPYEAAAASNLMGRKVDADSFASLGTSFAYVLKPGSLKPELCRFSRPRWILEKVGKEDVAARNSMLGILPTSQKPQARCKISDDFAEDAESAYGVLGEVRASGGVPFQDYGDAEPGRRRLVGKLLRLQYLKLTNSEIDGSRLTMLALTEKGDRAMKEFEKIKGGDKAR
ncbi:MAG: ATP-binding protein, partial [Candidatus Brockarchaeota archaeon]|nr:ATP-binding protein [Candidatus Brockarchaeota archaeon]